MANLLKIVIEEAEKMPTNTRTSTTCCDMKEEEEETYDNFDPTKDQYEWSAMSGDWRVEWDPDESSTTEFTILPKINSSPELPELEKNIKQQQQNTPTQQPSKKSRSRLQLFSRNRNRIPNSSSTSSLSMSSSRMSGCCCRIVKCCSMSRVISCCHKFRFALDTIRFNLLVIILVVMNCLAISGEIITDYVERVIFESRVTDESLSEFKSTTVGAGLAFLEQFFKYASLSIFCLQALEMTAKLVVTPQRFTHFLEFFDLVIVFFTFVLNVYLLNKSEHHVHSVTGLIILLR